MGYQIAFDTYESATQQFIGRILQSLRKRAPIPLMEPTVATTVAKADEKAAATAATVAASASNTAPAPSTTEKVEPMDTDQSISVIEEPSSTSSRSLETLVSYGC